MDPMTALSILGTVASLLNGAATTAWKQHDEGVRQQIEERVIALRSSKGVARSMLRSDIANIDVPDKAQAAKRALVSAKTQWEIDISAAMLEHQLGE